MEERKSNSPHRLIREEIAAYITGLGIEEWKYFSSSTFINWKIMFEDFVPRYLRGKVLDAGCGHAPYLEIIKKFSTQIVLLDYNLSHNEQAICADVQHLPLLNNSMDSILSIHVLEHVANPFEAMKEAGRVLNSGGILLLSVPHLSRLHELPHDYFRFTEYSLKQLAEISGFEVLEIVPTGGLWCFLEHQVSLALLIYLWKIRALRKVTILLNKYFLTYPGIFIDRLFGMNSLFPQGYALAAKKR